MWVNARNVSPIGDQDAVTDFGNGRGRIEGAYTTSCASAVRTGRVPPGRTGGASVGIVADAVATSISIALLQNEIPFSKPVRLLWLALFAAG